MAFFFFDKFIDSNTRKVSEEQNNKTSSTETYGKPTKHPAAKNTPNNTNISHP